MWLGQGRRPEMGEGLGAALTLSGQQHGRDGDLVVSRASAVEPVQE
jgi:hypothetical protein